MYGLDAARATAKAAPAFSALQLFLPSVDF